MVATMVAEEQNTTFQVGVILDADSPNARIGMTSLSLALSDFYASHTNYSTRIVLHSRDSRGLVTDAAAHALDLLNNVQVDAIIGPQKSSQANFVIGLGDAAKVPIISFSATSPSLHPQTPYFVQTALSDAAQVDAIAAIVKYFRWYQVNFIYEDSDYGNGIIPYLSNAFQQVNARVSYRSVIPLSVATNDSILDQELDKMKNMQTRVFVVHTTTPLASIIFLKAKELEMMNEGYVWIVTSGLMNLFYSLDPRAVESMQGVLSVKPSVPRSRKLKSTTIRWKKKFADGNPRTTVPPDINLYGLWAYDTLQALAIAAEKTGSREQPTSLQNTTVVNSTNIFTTGISKTGQKLLKAVLDTEFEGLAGTFKLVNGQFKPSSFQVLNIDGQELRQVGMWTPLSQSSSNQRNGNKTGFSGEKLENITWPGKSRNLPKGWEVSVSGKKLRVGVPSVAGFPEFVEVKWDPKTNTTNITGMYIDLFQSVMAALPYTVRYEYVPFEGSYDNLSYQVFNGNFDAAVGDITITTKRSEYLDFTLPVEQGGITMVHKFQYDNKINEDNFFVKPLQEQLWLTAIALFIFTGVALWILEHRFNKDFRGPPSEHIGLIFYIPFMSLVYSNRERIVSNLARLVLVVWVFVVLILNSTYTASLSAKFTIKKLDQNADSDVSTLIIKGHYVGCREGSFVCDFLKGLRFNESKIREYKSSEDFHNALSKGEIKVMFSRTPYTDLFLSKYCNNQYMKVGSPYSSEGVAFVFPKGSPLVADVSRAIIKLTDRHNITGTFHKWINLTCNAYNPSTDLGISVDLKSFKILFAITGGVTGTCLLVFLVSYFYRNRDFVRRISSSDLTTWSKICAIFKHFDQRDPRSFPSKQEGENTSPNLDVHEGCFSAVVPLPPDQETSSESPAAPQSNSVYPENISVV